MEATPDKAKPKDDKNSLKTLAMPELMKKLDASADECSERFPVFFHQTAEAS